jgi:hypothetical protein
MDNGLGHQDFTSHCNGDRRLWAAASSRAWLPTATVRVLAALRRRLVGWAETNLLARVHTMLVGMLRGHPDLILDSCVMRAKRGGELTGRNPTDRAKRALSTPSRSGRTDPRRGRGHSRQRQRHRRLRAPVPRRLWRRALHPQRKSLARWSAATLGCSKTGALRCATTGSASSSSPCSRPPRPQIPTTASYVRQLNSNIQSL